MAYDIDPAGQGAGSFGVRELMALFSEMQKTESGMNAWVARLPEGKDPDEVIRESPAAWDRAVRTPVQMMIYLIDHHASLNDVRTPEGRRRLIDAVMPLLREVGDPLRRDGYVQHLAHRTGVDEQILREALGRSIASPRSIAGHDGGRSGRPERRDAVLASPDALRIDDMVRAISPTEVELLRLLLLVPDQQVRVVDALGPDLLPSTLARELYRAIVFARAPDDHGVGGHWDRDAVLASLDEETRALALAIYARPGPDPAELPGKRIEYEVQNLLLDLEADRIEERNQYNLAEQADAERVGNADDMERLLNQQRQINEERRSLDRRREQARMFARPVAGRS